MIILLRTIRFAFGLIFMACSFVLIQDLGNFFISGDSKVESASFAHFYYNFMPTLLVGAIFFGLRWLINQIYLKKNPKAKPLLSSIWSL